MAALEFERLENARYRGPDEFGRSPPPSRAHSCRGPQLTAFFTSAPILASSAAVNSFSAKEVGHGAFVEVRLVAEAERRGTSI